MFDAKALLEQLAKGASQMTSPQGGGGLSDVLGQLQKSASQIGASDVTASLGKAFGQAVEGVKEGASRAGKATGASDAIHKASGGQTPEEIAAKVKDMIANNQLAAGAILGGLGSLMLGTHSGRSVAAGAAKAGALAMIGGLAYKAYQNHQEGKPLLTGASAHAVTPAPDGSGFEPRAMSNDAAMRMIRAMIAAAAADGRIDDGEQSRIRGAIGQAGLDREALAFLEREFDTPASAADIAQDGGTEEEAVQIYTAARIAIEPDTHAETAFLSELARHLGITSSLAQQIDAEARAATA